MTALMYAACEVSVEALMLLLDRKANLEAEAHEEGLTVLHMAARDARKNVVELLLERKANIEAVTGKRGMRVLHFPTISGHKEVVELLLDRKASIDSRAIELNWTALQMAAVYGQEEIADLLIDRKANINAKGEEGKTVLGMAIMIGEWVEKKTSMMRICELLLYQGARLFEASMSSWEVKCRAQQKERNEVVGLVVLCGFYYSANMGSFYKEHMMLYWSIVRFCQANSVNISTKNMIVGHRFLRELSVADGLGGRMSQFFKCLQNSIVPDGALASENKSSLQTRELVVYQLQKFQLYSPLLLKNTESILSMARHKLPLILFWCLGKRALGGATQVFYSILHFCGYPFLTKEEASRAVWEC